MITFVAFVLMFAGSINWLFIGFLQYDFIAGLFGFQASIFSRIIYILFGIGAFYFVIRIIANKGSVKVFERRKKASVQNVEAAKENVKQKQQKDFEKENFEDELQEDDFRLPEQDFDPQGDSLFDEHLRKK